MTKESLRSMAQLSESTKTILASIESPLLSPQTKSLDSPSDKSQSSYYPEEHVIRPEEISLVSQYMERHKILPQNTRIHKNFVDGNCVYELMLASMDIVKGDHSDELLAIYHSLK